jgi:hypothetical protein
MIFKFIRQTITNSAGTGNITLGSALTANDSTFESANVLNGAVITYTIVGSQNDFETGVGRYVQSENIFLRDTIARSSNNNSKIDVTSNSVIQVTYKTDEDSLFYNGYGAPPTTVGIPNSFYIDLTSWQVYGPKTNGVWGSANVISAVNTVSYLDITNSSAAPSAPSLNLAGRIYSTDHQLYMKGNTGTLGSPFIIPTYYYGAVTLTPNDPWERIINRHVGDGIITLANGVYDATGTITPTTSKIDIRSQYTGGANIRARWTVSNIFLRLYDMDLQPKDEGVYLLNMRAGYVDIRDISCNVANYSSAMTYLVALTDSSMTAQAVYRDNMFSMGTKVSGYCILLDGGMLKFSGTSSTKRNKILWANDSIGILAYTGKNVFTGTHFIGPALGQGQGIVLGRGSTAAMSQDMVFDKLAYGVRTNQEAIATFTDDVHPYGGQRCSISNCSIGLYRDSGKISYEDGTFTFANNSYDELQVTKTMRYVGDYEGQQTLMFSTGTGTVPAGATHYVSIGGSSATEDECKFPIPVTCTIQNLRHMTSGSPGSSQSYTITVRKNAVDTNLTASVTGSGVGASNLTSTVDFTKGDNLTIKIVTTAGATVRPHNISLELKY